MRSNKAIRFRQSVGDFPMVVSLGDKKPSFGVSRWGGSGLLFKPPDDEGFTLRGDKRRLVYKGRRRSHRFTILGDTAFEYDCILNREPESNVIVLLMKGAEKYNFFRQPDFVPDPFLKGSYAVYKKETLIGEGTGKLCHIHRPEIIDARGRRCWGELTIADNELRITIPEQWLAGAKYPVIVDPTVGTTSVGSQTTWYDPDNDDYYQLFIECSMAVNRFLLPETFNGSGTAYVYAYDSDYYGRCKPVLYSDNGNSPLTRRSANEGAFDIAIGGGKTAGWRSTAFQTNASLSSGSYIWYGLFCDWFAPRFDFGMKCYKDWWDLYGGNDIPNTYPVYNVNWYYDFKLSMYFSYSSAQNYVRTLTQGVRLNDSRKLTGNYKRTATQTTRINSTLSRFEMITRKCVETARNFMSINRLPFFNRLLAETVKAVTAKHESLSMTRKCADNVQANSTTNRISFALRTVQEGLKSLDAHSVSMIIVRSVPDTVSVTHTNSHWGEFFRGLLDNAGSTAETESRGDSYRTVSDTVQAGGSVFRGLLIFIKILTTSFVRDYLLRRFLVAREELILKSCITRELVLDSKIA